jgi:Flp pilus assembly protein TadB
MYTMLFLTLAVACALVGWMGNNPYGKALFAVFTIMYLFSLVFDTCTQREQALQDDEDEEDEYSVRHYFD